MDIPEHGGERPVLSIIIKSLNEEAKIARAIESSLHAIAEAKASGEVILADSLSSDRTVEIARRYPIRVVQLRSAQDRGCGAGLQLGYQWSRGEFVYFLDGDMQLAPDFLRVALEELRADPALAAVGGILRDVARRNAIDEMRNNNRMCLIEGDVPHLNGGGLYRRTAIDAAGGYAADRNLKAYEEAELGMRLQAAGYRLKRIGALGVLHEGHNKGTWALLAAHWRSRRAMSAGVVIRTAIGKPWFLQACRLLAHPICVLVLCLGIALLAGYVGVRGLAWVLAGWALFVLLGVCALALIKRDWLHALTSIYHWHYGALAILIGLFHRVVPAREPVPGVVVRDVAEPSGRA
jgi:glycosyltransferase involved in cell wall biosynthesis